MRSLLIATGIILLASCTPILTTQEPRAAKAEQPTQEQPTGTPEPTATVGYQSTSIAAQQEAANSQQQAVLAQQTADASMRLMVEATTLHETYLNQQLAYTAEVERMAMQVFEWTATAAPSSIPATQTQTWINNQVNATRQSMAITSVAMTQQEPTMIVALAQAQTQARFAPINAGIYVFAILSICIFMLCMAIFFLRKPLEIVHSESVPELDNTVVNVSKSNGGFKTTNRLVVPCSPQQLTELADGLIDGGKSLAVNQWEGRETTFTRPVYYAVRNFLQSNQFARGAGGIGNLAITSEGETFFRTWLETHHIPLSFEFLPREEQGTGETAHAHEPHGYVLGGEVVK